MIAPILQHTPYLLSASPGTFRGFSKNLSMRQLIRVSILCLFCSALRLQGQNTLNVCIEPGSSLFLTGSSNVNQFQCRCREPLHTARISIQTAKPGAPAVLSQARLPLRTTSLDCGNKFMNEDMYNSLKVNEHPHIVIELLQALPLQGGALSQNNQWVDLTVQADITIGGVKRRLPVAVKAMRLDERRFRFTGSRDLLMTDFNIQPPSAMMGFIKVRNEIRIHMDLWISTD